MFLIIALLINSVLPHKLNKDIKWVVNKQIIENVIVKSYIPLTNENIQNIKNEINIIKINFNNYYKTDCHPGYLEIRILKLEWLNSLEYFSWVDPNNIIYGRFYRINNLLYISNEALGNSKTLQHELLHYLYNECGFKLNDDQEHQQIEEFLK